MKTVLEYLEERKNMACHNLYCSSANYAMTIPKEGEEEQFAEYARDCEIVDELIAMVKEKDARSYECPFQKGIPIEEAVQMFQSALSIMGKAQKCQETRTYSTRFLDRLASKSLET